MSSSAMFLKFVGGAGVLIVGCCVYAYCKKKSNSLFKENPHEKMKKAEEMKSSTVEKLHLDSTILNSPEAPQDVISELLQIAEILEAADMKKAEEMKSSIIEKFHLDSTILNSPGVPQDFRLDLLEIGEIFMAADDVANAVEHLSLMVALSSCPKVEMEVLHYFLPSHAYQLIKKSVDSKTVIKESTIQKYYQALSKPRLLAGKLYLKKGDFVNAAKRISNLMEICFEPRKLKEALEKSLSPEICESLNKEMKKLTLAESLERQRNPIIKE